MTIKRGEDWGHMGPVAEGTPVARSDAELAAMFKVQDGQIVGPDLVGLLDGDLAQTVGASGDEALLRGTDRPHLPIDLAVVSLDGRELVMAGSLVIRARWWTGPVWAAMNAAFLDDWNVAPAGHPNDGRLDVIEANLSMGDRLKARDRLPTGSHVPHPDISVRRLKEASWSPTRRQFVFVDHVQYGGVSEVAVVVHPDASTLVI